MSKTNRKKSSKTLTFQDWGTFYYGQTLVCCGYADYADVKRRLKKLGCLKWLAALEDKKEEFVECHFSRWESGGKTWTLLWLKDWKPDLEHYKILAHELVHAVHFCMVDFLDILEEKEAVAYQHSYLFESIASELNKHHK